LNRAGTESHSRQIEAVRALARVSRFLERASDELSLAHYRVLSAVASGDERASRVANRLSLGKPAVSAAVDALTQRGLMSRSDVKGDQRATTLSLTADGQALLSRVETEMTERLKQLSERTPDASQLLESLVWMGAAIDELRATTSEQSP
jgi:DNA-binding MarR family transcriptional regulator